MVWVKKSKEISSFEGDMRGVKFGVEKRGVWISPEPLDQIASKSGIRLLYTSRTCRRALESIGTRPGAMGP
jgi:hypothetical protein